MGGAWCRRRVAKLCIPAALTLKTDAFSLAQAPVIHRFRVTRCCSRWSVPHSVVVIDDVANQPHLTAAELVQLQRIIEAGLLARDARLSGAGFADATEQELGLLEDQGALDRQRFIQANLGLVGMVSRQFAARCQLPDVELFQEGCLGLPACQLPTGSSRARVRLPTRQPDPSLAWEDLSAE